VPANENQPSYDLVEIKRLVSAGLFRIEPIALNGAGALNLDRLDIQDCILALEALDFHKTMPAKLRPGLFHDVYRPTYECKAIYCKIQIMVTREGSQAAIISFKKDLSR
jgi:hypothetical protein